MRSFNLAEAIPIIPGALEDILVRGAYLDHSARELARSRDEEASRLQAVRSGQPPFLFLRAKQTRMAFQAASQDTSESLTAITHALDLNMRLCDHLRTCSEQMLEKWLGTDCDEYRLGLAAGALIVDWEQSLGRLTDHARFFSQTLGAARTMATASYDRVREAFSPAMCESISVALGAAVKIEEAISAINAIAQEHERLLRNTVFNDPIPKLVHEPYASVVAQIASHPPASAHGEFNRVIAAVEDLVNREVSVLGNRVREAAQQHAKRTQMYVRNAWNQLHAYAVANSVDSQNVNAVVAETELTYLGRITDTSLVPA